MASAPTATDHRVGAAPPAAAGGIPAPASWAHAVQVKFIGIKWMWCQDSSENLRFARIEHSCPVCASKNEILVKFTPGKAVDQLIWELFDTPRANSGWNWNVRTGIIASCGNPRCRLEYEIRSDGLIPATAWCTRLPVPATRRWLDDPAHAQSSS